MLAFRVRAGEIFFSPTSRPRGGFRTRAVAGRFSLASGRWEGENGENSEA